MAIEILILLKYSILVLDDEESAVVTAGAIVTVTVSLTRTSLGSLLTGDNESANKTATNAITLEDEDKENKEGGASDQPQVTWKPIRLLL